MSLAPDDHALFGFESEAWLERLQQAESSAVLGRLGAYELLGEAGRGGQGVVFRARQPGTGREIALKRLLAGVFASAGARRRFEREVEAVTALSHPGIVTVYGVDVVEGAPLLAMEWIEGEPVNEWAEGKSRAEILALFLLVCDAVQHAHQRGVLHRDLKPSNVVVDAGGRPRVLDFGLAKLTSSSGATVSASGEFLGTPAYAAPEQWRGAEVDARADVYSLGALLFEMLTGRRVLAGDALAALAHAEHGAPPRPSSVTPSIPRELDAIVLQALAHERETRYQSVDALSGDVRRYLAGEPVLAHPPGTWYLLRKLVARNRLATGLVVTLLAATLVYALLATRQAGRLVEERNRAVAAKDSESRALASAVEEKRRAEEAQRHAEEEGRRVAAALAETERERHRAQSEQEKSEAVLKFLLEDVIAAADPTVLGHEPTLVEILRTAAPKVAERFGQSPAVELAVRSMLAFAFQALGHYRDAEVERRRSLELVRADPDSTPTLIAESEESLGHILHYVGKYDEAATLLEAAVAHFESIVPLDSLGLARALSNLGGVYLYRARFVEAIPLLERAFELHPDDPDILGSRNNLAIALQNTGRLAEARALFEEALAAISASGERNAGTGILLVNLGLLHKQLGDPAQAESCYRRALEFEVAVFGEHHARCVPPLRGLVDLLVERADFEEAEDLARRCLEITRLATPEGRPLAIEISWLARVFWKKGDYARAEPLYAEALALLQDVPDDLDRLNCAQNLGTALFKNGKLDEAEELLADTAERWRRLSGAGPDLASTLRTLASIAKARGEPTDAVALYEEVIDILTPIPAERGNLSASLRECAVALREAGDAERAAELERRAAELGR